MTAVNELDHEREFARAWGEARYTHGERPPVDVNAVLAAHYRLAEPLVFTRTMLWDMEVRKARRPDIYIPSVVREGSAATWGERALSGGGEAFYRRSDQRLRLTAEPAHGLVLEAVRVNPLLGKVTFIGSAELPDRDGTALRATTRQPLFHVEHVATGTELQPTNEWRVVHLTDGPDQRLVAGITRAENNVYLPEFIEVYIREVCRIEPNRR